jgi:hypothetical protein
MMCAFSRLLVFCCFVIAGSQAKAGALADVCPISLEPLACATVVFGVPLFDDDCNGHNGGERTSDESTAGTGDHGNLSRRDRCSSGYSSGGEWSSDSGDGSDSSGGLEPNKGAAADPPARSSLVVR